MTFVETVLMIMLLSVMTVVVALLSLMVVLEVREDMWRSLVQVAAVLVPVACWH